MKFIKSPLWLAVIALLIFWVVMVRQENKREIARYKQQIEQFEKQHKAQVDECIKLGIQEYKDMGSYPVLTTTGQYARDVIEKACNHDATIYHVVDVK